MLEASDLNDGAILQATRQETGGPNGSLRFKIKLEDGHEVRSEWIAPDQARKAIIQWCETIRQTAVQRAQEAAARRRPPIVDDASSLDTASATKEPPAVPAGRGTKSPDEPPEAYARRQVALLEGEVKHWYDQFTIGQRHYHTAQRKLQQWKQILSQLETEADDAE